MEKLALKSDYEQYVILLVYPTSSLKNDMTQLMLCDVFFSFSHSIIMDPNDKLSWSHYFTESDLDEIRDHQCSCSGTFPFQPSAIY